MKDRLWMLIFLSIFVRTARSDDLYLMQMHALSGPLPDNACNALLWTSDAVVYNIGDQAGLVTLLGISNGGGRIGVPGTLAVPAGRTVSIAQKTTWVPADPNQTLWVYHLDVPAGLIVDSELLPSVTNPYCTTPLFITQSLGKTRLPVFKRLARAGERQIVTGLMLGDLQSRINVGIYNSGSDVALATIETHRACDGALIESRLVTVPPDTIQQFGGFSLADSPLDCTEQFNGENGLNHLTYVVVTVNRPSLMYAAVLANGFLPTSTIQVSGVQSQ